MTDQRRESPSAAGGTADAAAAPGGPNGGICAYCGYALGPGRCARCQGTILDAPDGEPLRGAPRRGLPPIDFARGLLLFFRGGLVLFTLPEFAGKLKLPVAANLATVTVAGAALFLFFSSLFARVVGQGDLLGWFTGSLAALLTLVSILFLLPPLVELVTSPFLEPLADVIEKAMGGPGMQPIRRHLWADLRAGTQAAARHLLLAGALWTGTLVLALVGIGIPLGLLAGAALAAIVWLELPCYRRGWSFRQRLLLAKRNWAMALGFGCGFEIGAMIPLFNVFLLTPAAAAGVTMLFLRMDKSRTSAPDSSADKAKQAAGTAAAAADRAD